MFINSHRVYAIVRNNQRCISNQWNNGAYLHTVIQESKMTWNISLVFVFIFSIRFFFNKRERGSIVWNCRRSDRSQHNRTKEILSIRVRYTLHLSTSLFLSISTNTNANLTLTYNNVWMLSKQLYWASIMWMENGTHTHSKLMVEYLNKIQQ